MYKIKKIIKKIISFFYIALIKIKLLKAKTILIDENEKMLDTLNEKKNFSCYVDNRTFSNEIDLSIIIPAYNCEMFIEKCVESILANNTTYTYEIIIVDDGSKDKTNEIIMGLKDKNPNIVKVISKKNGGASSARNKGIDAIKGKYFSFLDSDDFIGKDYIQTLLSTAYEKNLEAVKCGTKTIDYDSKKTISIDNKPYNYIVGEMKDKILLYPSYVWGGVYKNSLIKNIKFPEGNWYEDMIWRFLVYRKLKSFVNINEVHHFRNEHQNQITKTIGKDKQFRCLEHLYLIEELVAANSLFDLKNDVYLYMNVLLECSTIMVNRIENLDGKVKEQVFLRVYKLVSNVYKEEYAKKLTGKYKLISRIILKKRYDLWLMLKYI